MNDASSPTSDPEDRSWQDHANCLGVDPDLFFPERGASTREAKEVCRGCVVREECLEFALAERREVRHLGRTVRARAAPHPPPAGAAARRSQPLSAVRRCASRASIVRSASRSSSLPTVRGHAGAAPPPAPGPPARPAPPAPAPRRRRRRRPGRMTAGSTRFIDTCTRRHRRGRGPAPTGPSARRVACRARSRSGRPARRCRRRGPAGRRRRPLRRSGGGRGTVGPKSGSSSPNASPRTVGSERSGP